MKTLIVITSLLLMTLANISLASNDARILSDDEISAEQLESRYGCSAIFHIEKDWHTIFSKEGCKSFVTPRYGYAIEQTQKAIARFKLHRVHLRVQRSEDRPSGSVINGAGKHSDQIIMTFLISLLEYDERMKPAN